MKKKIRKMLGIWLTLVLSISLALGMAAPVAASDYKENDWGEWGLPAIEPDTDVGTMAVAPDGTLYAAVYYWDDLNDDDEQDRDEWFWKVMKSEDNGYEWDDTELTELDEDEAIVSIVVSPNYDEDEVLYVGSADATVYRLEEAGEGDVTALKEITDSEGTSADELFSMDVWTDEDDYNWILIATDLDVFVLKDKTFEDWRDQELASGGDTWVAYEVAYAPDFDTSELIWAVIEENPNSVGGNFLVTATASPGQWGQEIGEVEIDLAASPFVDIGFPDDYDSDPDSGLTNLYVSLSSPDGGDIFLIEGVEDPDPSNAIAMFTEIGGEDPTDFTSIAVSGDYGEEIILAGERDNPVIWISDDGGYGWDDADKSPTGDGPTHVYMEADVVWGGEVFDTEEGMAFASTFGDESAVSRSNDGGLVWNQVGLIDTEIDGILDLAFHPDFPDVATYLLLTFDVDYDTDSLWLTENGDEDEPDYIRVLCGTLSLPGNHNGYFYLVEFSQDADAIYIWGVDDDRDSSIWKSTNDGQTFGKRRDVKDNASINDWVITDDRTIYAATDQDGFYKTTNSGLSWASADTDGAMWTIVLSPDFDDDEFIILGGQNGEVLLSDDAGDGFDDTDADLDGNVFVAFDADFAVEDADGETLIYAADDADNDILVGEVADTDDVDWDPLEDDTNEVPVTGDFYGLVVSEDNALYAIADDADYESTPALEDVTGVVRLLLHEDDSLWEEQNDSDLDDPMGLWLTPGSNVLWTIDTDDAELWVLEDTLSGQVTLDSPADGYQHDREDVIQLAWDEMRDADEYEYSGTETTGLGMDIGPDITDDTDVRVETSGSSEYEWKVRVAPDEPWHSRWSDEWTFHTALGPPPWAPTLYSPGGTYQYSGIDVVLMPGFIWESAKTADSYQFVLADNAQFTSPLVDERVTQSAYQLDLELEYASNYYWRVMAYKGDDAISRWSDIGVFTVKAEPVEPLPPVEVVVPPATVVEVELPAPITPGFIWAIIIIGAVLAIAVIVLIIRTRRVA